MTESDPEVMSFEGSHLEVAVVGLLVKFWVRLSSCWLELVGGGSHIARNYLT